MSQAPIASKVLWTRGQMTWVLFQIFFLAGLAALTGLLHGDNFQLLFTTPTGHKMFVGAVAFASLGLGCQLALFALLNRGLSGGPQGQRAMLKGVLIWAGAGGIFFVFVVPAIFALTVGPAALRISQTLQTSTTTDR